MFGSDTGAASRDPLLDLDVAVRLLQSVGQDRHVWVGGVRLTKERHRIGMDFVPDVSPPLVTSESLCEGKAKPA